MQEEMTQNKRPMSGSSPFWILVVITGLPFILAFYLFLNPDIVEQFGTKNRGALVQPTRTVPEMRLQTLQGPDIDTSSAFAGKWTLLMVAGSACDQACEKNLYHLRQIRLATGEERFRVQRLMLLTDLEHKDALQARMEPYKGTQVIVGPEEQRQKLLELLRTDDKPVKDRIYNIDPQGRLILAYDVAPEWKDVLKDLQHLIKVVQQ